MNQLRTMASNLRKGEMVDLADAPLFHTMRASLALQGVFAPVRLLQQLLVDGGLDGGQRRRMPRPDQPH